MLLETKYEGYSVNAEKVKGGRLLVRHNELERAAKRLGIKVKTDLVLWDEKHWMAVATASVEDAPLPFTPLLKVGESNPASSKGKLGKGFPVTTAIQRAYDKAVMQALGLPTRKVFNEEKLEDVEPTMELESPLGIFVPVHEEEDGMLLISHETLEKIVEEYHIDVNIVWSKVSDASAIVCAKASIGNDPKTCKEGAEKIGEANGFNLDSDMSKAYPATMAYIRAIDRAVISLLDIDSNKLYSTSEIEGSVGSSESTDEEPKTPIPEEMPEDAVEETLPFEPSESSTVEEPAPTPEPVSNPSPMPDPTPEPEPDPEPDPEPIAALFDDDEIILIGNCRNKKYGEVKGSPEFATFLTWVRDASPAYASPEKMNQFEKFKKLAS